MLNVVLADGFEEIEALSVVDILRRAKIDVRTVSVNQQSYVTGAHGIKVETDRFLDEISSDDLGIILPGGMPGTTNLLNNKFLANIINNFYNSKKLIGAICAAPMILGELMLLKDKTATCYPSYENHLIGADVKLDRVCVSKNIITSRGAGTAHDFAFKFVEIIKGKDVSDKIRSSMLYD